MEKSNNSDWIDQVAAVRGLAALVVLVAHAVQIFWLRFLGLQSWPHLVSSAASHYAVVIFFVLSGFLIAHSVELNMRRHGGHFRLTEFFAARLARLYPPFLFALGLTVGIYLLLGYFNLPGRAQEMRLPGDLYAARDILHLTYRQVGNALLMIDGMLEVNGPLWSLYMEAKLYIIFACVYSMWKGTRSIAVLLLLIAVSYAGLRFNPEFSRYAAMWFTGCCAYYAFSYTLNYAWASEHRSRLFLCMALCLLFAGIDTFMRLPGLLTDATRGVWADVLICMVISWLLFRSPIRLRFGGSIAPYSYSLYVVHFPVLLLFQSLLIKHGSRSAGEAGVVCLLACVVALLLAKLSGRLEARKDAIQGSLLALYAGIGAKLRLASK